MVKIHKRITTVDDLNNDYDYEVDQTSFYENDNFTFDIFDNLLCR